MADYYILEDGEIKPVEWSEWALWTEEGERRRIDLTDLDDGTSISTVFLSINHAFGGGETLSTAICEAFLVRILEK